MTFFSAAFHHESLHPGAATGHGAARLSLGWNLDSVCTIITLSTLTVGWLAYTISSRFDSIHNRAAAAAATAVIVALFVRFADSGMIAWPGTLLLCSAQL